MSRASNSVAPLPATDWRVAALSCVLHTPMSEYRFDPALRLKGDIVVRNLDDAVRFMTGYRKARRPALQTSVLHRLEGAASEAEERESGNAFLEWAEAEHLIAKFGE